MLRGCSIADHPGSRIRSSAAVRKGDVLWAWLGVKIDYLKYCLDGSSVEVRQDCEEANRFPGEWLVDQSVG